MIELIFGIVGMSILLIFIGFMVWAIYPYCVSFVEMIIEFLEKIFKRGYKNEP